LLLGAELEMASQGNRQSEAGRGVAEGFGFEAAHRQGRRRGFAQVLRGARSLACPSTKFLRAAVSLL